LLQYRLVLYHVMLVGRLWLCVHAGAGVRTTEATDISQKQLQQLDG
jgi:hypothetical protein